ELLSTYVGYSSPYPTLFRSIEPVGLQAGYQGREVGGDPLDVFDAQLLGDVFGHIGSGAHGLPRDRVDVAVGDFIGDSDANGAARSEEHTSELQSRENLVCRL